MSSTTPSLSNGVQANGDRARPLLERLSTPPIEYPTIRDDEDVPMLSVQEPAYPYGNMHPSFNRRRGDWYHSLGAIFGPSRRSPESPLPEGEFHATVTPCTGDEMRLRRLEPTVQSADDQRRSGFDLDLVNRVEYFGLSQVQTNTIFLGRGQLVHQVVERMHPTGRKLEVNPDGPFILIDRCNTHYILMTRQGDLFPRLVPAHCIFPCLSTWHVVDIPRALLNHPEVKRLQNEYIRV
jgi:hypothetical protein